MPFSSLASRHLKMVLNSYPVGRWIETLYKRNFCPRVKLCEKNNILSTSLIKVAADKHQDSRATCNALESKKIKLSKQFFNRRHRLGTFEVTCWKTVLHMWIPKWSRLARSAPGWKPRGGVTANPAGRSAQLGVWAAWFWKVTIKDLVFQKLRVKEKKKTNEKQTVYYKHPGLSKTKVNPVLWVTVLSIHCDVLTEQEVL